MIHPSSGFAGYINLTVPFQVLWQQPSRQNDSDDGNLQALWAPRQLAYTIPLQGTTVVLGSNFLLSRHHKMGTIKSSSLLLLLIQLPTAHALQSCQPKGISSREKVSKEMNQLHRYQLNAIISYTQLPSPAIHCEIWKPGLSLGSLVNQRDAQGQWSHAFKPGSKGSSLSESYWPTYLYIVLTDYKLKHLFALFSSQWNTKTLCITSSLYSPESANKKPCLSQHLLGRTGLHIGKKQNGLEVWIRKRICIYLWRQNLISDDILIWN